MSDRDFENVRGQMGCCGIWCGSCIVGNGALAEITRRYKRLLDLHSLPEWGPQDVDYEQFNRGLCSIQAMTPCKGCRKGGGRDDCELRSCAAAKGLHDCIACADRGGVQCGHGELLEHMRSGAARAGLLVKEPAAAGQGTTGATDEANLIKAWTEEIHSRWPHALLFDGQDGRW